MTMTMFMTIATVTKKMMMLLMQSKDEGQL